MTDIHSRIRHRRQRQILAVLLLVLLSGCDPVARHKALSTIFDGVPSLPPAEQYCAEYEEQKKSAARDKRGVEGEGPVQVSQHAPYLEKKCSDCHDKSSANGLVRPKEELCSLCHPDLIKGPRVHGPAAVGDCLVCHEPHSANVAPLLKSRKNELCAKCHREGRLAAKMHDRLGSKKMDCVDCHDPHSGTVQYFLN